MMRSSLALLLCVGSLWAEEPTRTKPVTEDQRRESAAKAIQIVQKSQAIWYKKQQCTACHHQILPTFALAMAQQRGIPFDAKLEQEIVTKTYSFMKDFDTVVQGVNYIDEFDQAWRLLSNHASGIPANLSTTADAQFLASTQRADGSWYTFDSRPPQASSRFTLTAAAARAIQLYLPSEAAEQKRRILERAGDWLAKATPHSTEDRVFQILGHFWTKGVWTGADVEKRAALAEQLLALQNKDGGWGQLKGYASDAYSTGQVIYALQFGSRIFEQKPDALQQALHFLVSTQNADGSWKVESRVHPPAPVSPPYVSAEFPYGRAHQYSSIAGTAWAIMGLLATLPVKDMPKIDRPVPDVAPEIKDEWVKIVLQGSLADLKKALDNGLKPNVKTAKGTTALMLATHDPAKVKLLLDAGADAKARADSGFDALIMAARHRGNAEVLQRLLKHGATVQPPKDKPATHNAAAILYAVATGDTDMVKVLLDAKATVNHKMVLLGMIPMNTLEAATLRNDVPMLELLLARGANVNEANEAKMTPLSWAAIGGHGDVTKLLLAKGAKVNVVDELGMTPLLYAAAIDFGNTSVVEQLLAAGADTNAKDEKGRTAQALAQLYRHHAHAKLLSTKGKRE